MLPVVNRPSIRLSHTLQYCVKTAKYISLDTEVVFVHKASRDDGANGQKAARDRVWGGDIPPQGVGPEEGHLEGAVSLLGFFSERRGNSLSIFKTSNIMPT